MRACSVYSLCEELVMELLSFFEYDVERSKGIEMKIVTAGSTNRDEPAATAVVHTHTKTSSRIVSQSSQKRENNRIEPFGSGFLTREAVGRKR
ncbi:tRNA pseudouridine(38-40) synthase [Anopheles sinensis]|uniref:tRNA pseudouridine(38-40) synthase n=1 Tax=Anopheles sinensis TaxID=74873 RepID=A0A084W7D4_ANOSI|nr:tRNA pseudouridine(38-40) synthase [Anopheles sinensis]